MARPASLTAHDDEEVVMAHLLIEHRVADYERWVQAFDSDLRGDGSDGDTFRRQLGVRNYRVMRGVDDPDLEYDSRELRPVSRPCWKFSPLPAPP
jgi:hypothetical protein